MSLSFADVKAGYAHLWDEAQIGSPHVDAAKESLATAHRVLEHKDFFVAAEKATGAPWWWIACALYRESDLNLNSYLGNGQSIHHVTTVVPKGRGPFASFIEGAVDALKLEGLYQVPASTWTVEYALWSWERLNGLGYFKLNVNSPYIWNWTTLYNGGKYVADHVFSRTEFDVQGGTAAILKQLMTLDQTVSPRREGAAPQPQKEPPVSTPPGIPKIDLSKLATMHDEIGKLISFIDTALPMIVPFVPQLAPLQAAGPAVHALHDMAGALEAAGGDPSKMIQAIEAHLGDLLHLMGGLHLPTGIPQLPFPFPFPGTPTPAPAPVPPA